MDPREERIEKAYGPATSAQPCGCDPGCRTNGKPTPWVCEQHQKAELHLLAAGVSPAKVAEVRHTATTGGQKGRKLARFCLLPYDALWAIAEHFGRGAEKYEDRNWERGYPWSWTYDAMQRHFAAFWHRDDNGNDPKFGRYLHVVAGAWHALVLVAFVLRGAGTDDRPTNAIIAAAKEDQ